ncbi:SDR family oxidoreductase [Nocardia pseudobrasiliensis]|uniref:NADP-dependent 3-hydroxy acid dehydrogenase YdfG n=1 Tax=Nocardia pseudobrasiliensis TaxID=45979 RepID=A0A370I889_9NOCA|nr:SDR family oxidoreductase [Nocardia pseudobrasiliensis]RDI66341.1 NADP-dependent 3-hydroxy acid dehydrogenase YdfG [Nocardia pseudobrasiliensis]
MSEHKTILVTGASSGIGAAVAARLAAEGHHVIAGARRVDRLHALAERIASAATESGGSLHPTQLDVTDRADVGRFVALARERTGRVDALISNAGVMPLSRLDSLLVDEWERMIDVNIRGLLYGIAAALPHFSAQGSGHFVTVASIGAHQVVPTGAVYSGTKYAAWAITEGLRQECDPSIRVTTISPGVVTSELADSITEPGAAQAMRTYRAHALEPDAIASAVSYALSQPDDVDVNEIIVRPARGR